MANFIETLVEVLKVDERFFTEDGTLLRNKVYESVLNMDDQHLSPTIAIDVNASSTAAYRQWVVAATTKRTLLIAPDKKHCFAGSLPGYNLL